MALVTVAGSLNDSETIHRSGMSAYTMMRAFADPQPTRCLAVAAIGPQLLPGAAAPNPLMNRKAMIATEMKMSTEIADPMPRLRAEKRLS